MMNQKKKLTKPMEHPFEELDDLVHLMRYAPNIREGERHQEKLTEKIREYRRNNIKVPIYYPEQVMFYKNYIDYHKVKS